ncbi:MAG TPA: response regulator [Candidatus Saccharimonadales bacterium]|nr:response regulator [Candidatus Saccharimonadales bacterium]
MTRISDPHDAQLDTGETARPNGKRIVLAEDDPFISRMYDTKLSGAGYAIHLASNGREAYELVKTVAPDLVMMDINMPELTGFEVITALKNDGFDLKKIIVLTNSPDNADRDKAKEFGVDFMVKADMTPREVLEKINSFFAKS